LYYSATVSTKRNVVETLHRRVQKSVKEEILSLIQPKLLKRINAFSDVVLRSSPDNMDELIKYIYRAYKLDVRGIFQFVFSTIRNKIKDFNYDAEEEESVIKEKSNIFKENFIDKLKDQVNNYKKSFQENGSYFESSMTDKFFNYIKKLFPFKGNGLNFSYDDLEKINEKDIDNLADVVITEIVVDSFPNFARERGYGNRYALPDFSGVGAILTQVGKFSVDSIANNVHSKVPFAPKEFITHLVKSIFKQQFSGKPIQNPSDLFKELAVLHGTNAILAMKVLLDLLKRSGKYNQDNFTKAFIENFKDISGMVAKVSNEFILNGEKPYGQSIKARATDDDIIKMFSFALRSFDTIERDKENIDKIISYIHNSASGLSKDDVIKLFSNKNYKSYATNGLVQKVYKAYLKIRSAGGVAGIETKYGDPLKELKEGNFINKKFETNLRFISKVFNSGEEINPSLPNFKKIFEIASTVETDLETIAMGDSLKEILKKTKPKDQRLYRLDLQINDRLRFRVLKDKDPRMLRVGIESDCCQRIGGAGEISARDSFVNPFAGVLILEWKNDAGLWVLLAQSYFHYVEKTEAFILDNVEKNQSNVNESEVDLPTLYSYLAQKVNAKYNVGYFLAGKGYSKIPTEVFKTKKLQGGDPRHFSQDALTENRRSFYTDFSASDSMNLLEPKFDLEKRISPYLKEVQEIKKAFGFGLTRITKTALIA
jgi:hypothetical protein